LQKLISDQNIIDIDAWIVSCVASRTVTRVREYVRARARARACIYIKQISSTRLRYRGNHRFPYQLGRSIKTAKQVHAGWNSRRRESSAIKTGQQSGRYRLSALEATHFTRSRRGIAKHSYLGIPVAKPRYNVVDEHADVLALDALARVAEVIEQRIANVQLLLDVRR